MKSQVRKRRGGIFRGRQDAGEAAEFGAILTKRNAAIQVAFYRLAATATNLARTPSARQTP